MLWLIAGILFALWVLGLAFKIAGGLVYIALVAAVILFIVGFFKRGASSAP
jgi:hypothetical protein